MAAPAPVNNAFTPAQLDIIRSIPGSAGSLAEIDGANGYDAVFNNLVAAIGRANDNPVDYTAVTGRLSMLNRRLTQRLARIRARFEYYAGVEGLSLQLLEKLANAKLLFNLAMGRLNRGVIGENQFNAVVDRLEGFVAELDAVVPPPDGGYPEPPPDGAAPGGGDGGGGGGGAVAANPLADGGAAARPIGDGRVRGENVAALRARFEPAREVDPDQNRRVNEDPLGRRVDDQLGGKRKSKRASKRKMIKTKTKKSRKVSRKQRGGFRYVTKPKTKRHSSSSSSSSTPSTMSSARN